MKAWRKEAEEINARKAAGSKEPSARVQMHQARHINRMFKPKGSGNWLMDALLLNGGFKAAVYGDIVNLHPKVTAEEYDNAMAAPVRGLDKSWFGRAVAKAKAWWNS